MKTEIIQSLKDLQLKMPAIINQYGKDNNLTKLALANPIAALERAGLTFTNEAKEEIETHVRFGKEGAKYYDDLKEKINAAAGTSIDLKNRELVADTIVRLAKQNDTSKPQKQIKKDDYQANIVIDRQKLLTTLNSPPKKTNNQWQDALSEFSAVHPLIPLLIQFRQMDAENPAFASSKDIPAIEERLRKSPFTNVVFSLKRNNTDTPK
jgi:hypothetical protein